MQKGVYKSFFLILVCVMFAQEADAQYNIQHQAPTTLERGQLNLIEFVVPGLTQNDIQQAVFYYQYDGDFSFSQQEVQISNGSFSITLNVDNTSASSLLYYLEVTLLSGEVLQYPANSPEQNPVQVQIVEGEEKEAELDTLEEVDYSILSPKAGNGVTKDDVIIAIALFYDINRLEEGEFRLFLDDADITEKADTSDYYISYAPGTMRGGEHRIKLEYHTAEKKYRVTDWNFYVVSEGQQTFAAFGSPSNKPQGQLEFSARNQVVAGDVNNAYVGQGRVSGRYEDLRYSVSSYLTSQESSRLQPQNRIGINLRYQDWLEFQGGHVYPNMTKFTISGRRVFGINTKAFLLDRKLNLQFIYGKLDRQITNLYEDLIIAEQTTSSGVVVDTSYTLTYASQGKGAFRRNVLGGRVGFGDPRKFEFGIHAIKIKDDTTSLYNIRDYTSLMQANPDLYSNLTTADHQKLSQNPEILSVQGGSVNPRDNIVAGADMRFALNNNRIRFEAEGVASALNDNIYGGPLTVERADELGFDLSQKDVDLLDQLSWLIIINENMNTLPIRLKENASGDDEAEAFFPTSILASNSQLTFNYPSNNLRVQYRWIGPNFNSLANTTIRKDVAGYTITDRLNLLSNRIYLTLGYESLRDNVVGNKNSTTETDTYRTNVSWYPVTRDLPRVSLGFRFRTRDNGLERYNPYVPSGFEDAAVRNLREVNPDSLVLTGTPRMNKTYNFTSSITQQFRFLDILHDASLSFYNLVTNDQVFAYGDVNSRSLSLNITSRFNELPLRTQVGLSYNNTDAGSGQSVVKIFGMYAGGNYFLMDNKLSVNGQIAFTSNRIQSRILDIEGDEDTDSLNDYYVLSEQTTENNYGTFVLQAGAQYDINEFHALLFDANLTNVTGAGNANDRLVQLRYIFRF